MSASLTPGTRCAAGFRGLRYLRAGAYRIIYQLSENDQTVRVLAIRHRSIAYRTDPAERQARALGLSTAEQNIAGAVVIAKVASALLIRVVKWL